MTCVSPVAASESRWLMHALYRVHSPTAATKFHSMYVEVTSIIHSTEHLLKVHSRQLARATEAVTT